MTLRHKQKNQTKILEPQLRTVAKMPVRRLDCNVLLSALYWNLFFQLISVNCASFQIEQVFFFSWRQNILSGFCLKGVGDVSNQLDLMYGGPPVVWGLL